MSNKGSALGIALAGFAGSLAALLTIILSHEPLRYVLFASMFVLFFVAGLIIGWKPEITAWLAKRKVIGT